MPKTTYLAGDTLEATEDINFSIRRGTFFTVLEHTDKVLYVESGPSSHPERSHLKSDENRFRLVESLQYDY